MAKPFYFWQTVSKKAKFSRFGLYKGQMATLPPAWIGQEDIDFLGNVGLGKVLFSYNYKYCQRAQTFSLGTLKLTCAIYSCDMQRNWKQTYSASWVRF